MINKVVVTTIAVFLIAFTGLSVYQLRQIKVVEERNEELSSTVIELTSSVVDLQETVSNLNKKVATLSEVPDYPTGCTAKFPVGLYQLTTLSRYSTAPATEYDIYHVTSDLGGWQVNAGVRVNSFLIPTDFYFDYDGDGIIDTSLAARLVREIPVAGTTLADRLISNTSVHQALYDVFSCEWREAKYTSVQDVGDGVSGALLRLWTLIQDNSSDLIEWIQEDLSSVKETEPD